MKETYHSQSIVRALYPHCAPELVGKSWSAAGRWDAGFPGRIFSSCGTS
jgi:hypothetical protein